MITREIISFAAAMTLAAGAAAADEAWDELRPILYDDRAIESSAEAVALSAPYRTPDDRRTVLGAEVAAPIGAAIASVSLIIDNNPMPVSAEFEMLAPVARFSFSTTMRIDRPSPVRVVMETTEGEVFMSEGYVKTSGVGACAAPPGTDPVIAMQTLGQMTLAAIGSETQPKARLASLTQQALSSPGAAVHRALQIQHPSLSGMQKDQITLLYIPARYVEEIAVSADGAPQFKMTGSISLSENPAVSFDLPASALAAEVTLTDSEGAVFKEVFAVGGAS